MISQKGDRIPECGLDFCDACGDCLACYGDDPCTGADDGVHMWVYRDEGETCSEQDEDF